MDKIHFEKKDIGSEILPILTMGLYHDPLDAIREYVQNAIDAHSKHIHISINASLVSITDDGIGMTRSQAIKSMRLGISDKNPEKHIGFRGIGIYSAYDVCDRLEIHTTSQTEDGQCRVVFDFAAIRQMLGAERERRLLDLEPELHLEQLLHDCVFVEDESDAVLGPHGTKVILAGLRPESYMRLNSWAEVEDYLQNVIPLPFNPQFKFADILAAKFNDEDYRVVDSLTLKIHGRESMLYRPYTNELFKYGGKYEPRFERVCDPASGEDYGFAWICINDARAVLKNTKLRGLLIKKFGFSIANRNYLEPFFGRTVFNRRITGEIIVQSDKLIPNAARSDFEGGAARKAFLRLLPSLTLRIDNWANAIQEDERSKEVLGLATTKLADINSKLLLAQRDIDRLLLINRDLVEVRRQLENHDSRLRTNSPSGYEKAMKLLLGAEGFIQHSLTVHHNEQEEQQTLISDEVVAAVQREKLKPTRDQARLTKDIPADFATLFTEFGLIESNDLKRVITYLDSSVLRQYLEPEEYSQAILDLRDYIEVSN